MKEMILSASFKITMDKFRKVNLIDFVANTVQTS